MNIQITAKVFYCMKLFYCSVIVRFVQLWQVFFPTEKNAFSFIFIKNNWQLIVSKPGYQQTVSSKKDFQCAIKKKSLFERRYFVLWEQTGLLNATTKDMRQCEIAVKSSFIYLSHDD